MRRRPSARLLVFSPENRLLLFHFIHECDALAGQSYWATPGGAVEGRESFAQAAVRELQEETGWVIENIGSAIARRTFTMMLPNGETVMADERFFVVLVASEHVNFSQWSRHEQQVMSKHHWWSLRELKSTQETIFPRDLIIEVISRHNLGKP